MSHTVCGSYHMVVAILYDWYSFRLNQSNVFSLSNIFDITKEKFIRKRLQTTGREEKIELKITRSTESIMTLAIYKLPVICTLQSKPRDASWVFKLIFGAISFS